jgi:hypothetical protein
MKREAVEKRELAGQLKNSEKTRPPSETINPTSPDLGSNPGHRGRKPATNRLSYGTALHLPEDTAENHDELVRIVSLRTDIRTRDLSNTKPEVRCTSQAKLYLATNVETYIHFPNAPFLILHIPLFLIEQGLRLPNSRSSHNIQHRREKIQVSRCSSNYAFLIKMTTAEDRETIAVRSTYRKNWNYLQKAGAALYPFAVLPYLTQHRYDFTVQRDINPLI